MITDNFWGLFGSLYQENLATNPAPPAPKKAFNLDELVEAAHARLATQLDLSVRHHLSQLRTSTNGSVNLGLGLVLNSGACQGFASAVNFAPVPTPTQWLVNAEPVATLFGMLCTKSKVPSFLQRFVKDL